MTTTLNQADFSPVQSTLPQASQVGNPAKVKRHSNPPTVPNLARAKLPKGLAPIAGARTTYPQSVTCYKYINVYYQRMRTKTTTTSTTTLATPISTEESTSTFVVTETSDPGGASTTITQTNTIVNTELTTPVVTSTSTESIVFTATAPGALAMCSSDNFANAVNGAGIVSIFDEDNPNDLFLYTGDANAAACCDSCSIMPDCSAFGFLSRFPAGRKCQIVQQPGETCTEGKYSFTALLGGGEGSAYTVGNGNCAFITQAEAQ